LKGDTQYAERASNFSRKIIDICQFLIEIIGLKPGINALEGKVTYHESCHMRWMQKVSAQPRQALGLIPGLEFVEMNESDTCCGGAGSYNLTHYQTSMNILDRKMANIAATGAGLIATGCPGCRIQLRLGVKRRGLEARVVHPVELLEQSSRES
jgi:glycolate oxidase iron-sulfur subunit